MSFPHRILRGHNVTGIAAVNSDSSPLTLTGPAAVAYSKADNAWAPVSVNESGAIVAKRFAAAYVGAAGAGAATLEVDIYDPDAEAWYAVAAAVALTSGSVIALPVPILGGRDRASAPSPVYAFVLTVADPADGSYSIAFGVDFGAGFGS